MSVHSSTHSAQMKTVGPALRSGFCRRTSRRACSSNRCRRTYSFQSPEKTGATPQDKPGVARSLSPRAAAALAFDGTNHKAKVPPRQRESYCRASRGALSHAAFSHIREQGRHRKSGCKLPHRTAELVHPVQLYQVQMPSMAEPSQPRAQACLTCACDFNRLSAHIFAVEFEKVESADVRGHGAHERPELAGDEENAAAYTNIEAVRTENRRICLVSIVAASALLWR
jgi:hypothetical protein